MNEVDAGSHSPLEQANWQTEAGLSLMELLLQRGADINYYNKEGDTVLHSVLKRYFWEKNRARLAAVRFLLSKGAEVNTVNQKGDTPLHTAVGTGDIELIQAMLAQGADCNQVDAKEHTPLQAALLNGQYAVVEFLIKQGFNLETADWKACDEEGNTVLHRAIVKNNIAAIQWLVKHGASVKVANKAAIMPLHIAVRIGDLVIVQYLLDQGADVNAIDTYGRSPLATVSWYEWKSASSLGKLLLERGADINYCDQEGYTVLHRALSSSTFAVRLLLAHGAKVNTVNQKGDTPLHTAVKQYNIECAQALLEQGADCTQVNAKGHTPLQAVLYAMALDWKTYYQEDDTAKHKLESARHLSKVQLLVEHGADVHARNKHNCVIHQAVGGGYQDVVSYLLDQGAHINVVDKRGNTPLVWASEKDAAGINMMALLLRRGAAINQVNNEGNTVLHLCAKKGCLEVVLFLLAQGADPGIQNHEGKTSAQLAAERGNTGLAMQLEQAIKTFIHADSTLTKKAEEGADEAKFTVQENFAVKSESQILIQSAARGFLTRKHDAFQEQQTKSDLPKVAPTIYPALKAEQSTKPQEAPLHPKANNQAPAKPLEKLESSYRNINPVSTSEQPGSEALEAFSEIVLTETAAGIEASSSFISVSHSTHEEENKLSFHKAGISSQHLTKGELAKYVIFGTAIGGSLGAGGCLAAASIMESALAFPPVGIALAVIGGGMALGMATGMTCANRGTISTIASTFFAISQEQEPLLLEPVNTSSTFFVGEPQG